MSWYQLIKHVPALRCLKSKPHVW